jgi:hypothetical protein
VIRTGPTATAFAVVGTLSPSLLWFHDWTWFSFNWGGVVVLAIPGFGTWSGWVVFVLDGIVAAARLRSVGLLLGAVALVCLAIAAAEQLSGERFGLDLALGSQVRDWNWLRWEFAVPIAANTLLVVSCWPVRPKRQHDECVHG